MNWVWTVTTPTGRFAGCEAEPWVAANWVEFLLAHTRGYAMAEITGPPGWASVRLVSRDGAVCVPDADVENVE